MIYNDAEDCVCLCYDLCTILTLIAITFKLEEVGDIWVMVALINGHGPLLLHSSSSNFGKYSIS